MDFVLVRNENQRFIGSVKELPGVFQHWIVAADVDKERIRNVVRKIRTETRKTGVLKDVN